VNLSEAQAELDGRGFDYLPEGRKTQMLNRARNDFEDFWLWPWLVATKTGAAPLTISDVKYVLLVKDAASHRELLGVTASDLGQDDTDVAAAGTPTSWWIDDSAGDEVLNVWPVAPATLSVRYVRESPELSNGTDTPLIPARYHPLWIDLAVVRALQDSDNFPSSQMLRTDAYGAAGPRRSLRDAQPPEPPDPHPTHLQRRTTDGAPRYTNGYQPFAVNDFAGGLNLRDKADASATSEAIDLLNVDFTERGAVRQRDGFTDLTPADLTVRVDSMTAYYNAPARA
jgi:hypothetical protein